MRFAVAIAQHLSDPGKHAQACRIDAMHREDHMHMAHARHARHKQRRATNGAHGPLAHWCGAAHTMPAARQHMKPALHRRGGTTGTGSTPRAKTTTHKARNHGAYAKRELYEHNGILMIVVLAGKGA